MKKLSNESEVLDYPKVIISPISHVWFSDRNFFLFYENFASIATQKKNFKKGKNKIGYYQFAILA